MPSIIPSIPIDLDSRRHLLFTQGAVIMAEQELTKFWGREYYFFEAMQRILDFAATADLKKLSMANLAIILWQGCCHEDAQLTLQQVQAALPHIGDAAAIARLVRAILDAWQAGNPPMEAVQEGAADPNPLDGSIGPPVGPSLVSTSA